MQNHVRKTAEEKFSESQKKREKAVSEAEAAKRRRATHTAELKERRLAKEASDRKASEAAASKKTAQSTS